MKKLVHSLFPLFLCLCLSTVFLSGCVSQKSSSLTGFTAANLMGMVYDSQDTPVKGVQIVLIPQITHIAGAAPKEEMSEPPKEPDKIRGVTDIEGRFLLPDVPSGTHRMELSAPDYEPLVVSFSFFNRTQVFHGVLISASHIAGLLRQALDEGDIRDAAGQGERIMGMETEDPEALYLAALAFYRNGDREAAGALLDRMLPAHRDLEAVAKLLELIKAE